MSPGQQMRYFTANRLREHGHGERALAALAALRDTFEGFLRGDLDHTCRRCRGSARRGPGRRRTGTQGRPCHDPVRGARRRRTHPHGRRRGRCGRAPSSLRAAPHRMGGCTGGRTRRSVTPRAIATNPPYQVATATAGGRLRRYSSCVRCCMVRRPRPERPLLRPLGYAEEQVPLTRPCGAT